MERRKLGGVLAAVLVMLASGCGVLEDDGSTEPEPPAAVKSKADAEKLVRQQFDSIVQLTGGTWTNWEEHVYKCFLRNGFVADDGRWEMRVSASVTPPANQRATAVPAVHDKWKAQGWTINKYGTDTTGRHHVDGSPPKVDASVSFYTYKPHVIFYMDYDSPCYKPAPNENPAQGA